MPHLSAARARTSPEIRLRTSTAGDGARIWALARDCGLDLNSPYAYVLFADRFSSTTVVAEAAGGELAGFVLAVRVPDEPDTVFVWQVAVASPWRGLGIGGRLLDELVARTGAGCIEATVTPSNAASAATFRALAARHGTEAAVGGGYEEHLFPDGHQREVLFRVPTKPDRGR